MKVLLINGSPNKAGCTFTALNEVSETLKAKGIDTDIYHIGNKAVRGCSACWGCGDSKRCVFDDDVANEMADLIRAADGVVIGSPVYYASINGTLSALLDRVFFSASSDFAYKPAAGIVSCRRGGATAAFDRLNKYFTISKMPVVSSQYWNGVHGMSPEEVKQDLEGMQIMRTLGLNMAWLLKNIAAGKGSVELPNQEEWTPTNFIR
jgi:Multimeric flavodoxin WrbA